MKLRFTYFIAALLCAAVCFSSCTDQSNETGNTEPVPVETVIQTENGDPESESESSADTFSINGDDTKKTEEPFIPKEQENPQSTDSPSTDSRESDSQDQSSETVQQTAQDETYEQITAATDPYEGNGY